MPDRRVFEAELQCFCDNCQKNFANDLIKWFDDCDMEPEDRAELAAGIHNKINEIPNVSASSFAEVISNHFLERSNVTLH